MQASQHKPVTQNHRMSCWYSYLVALVDNFLDSHPNKMKQNEWNHQLCEFFKGTTNILVKIYMVICYLFLHALDSSSFEW